MKVWWRPYRFFSTSRVRRCIYFNDKFDPNESKFSKILIANRGEIACRVIRTCNAMGIKSVAVHSDVDSVAKHVRMADESVCVGPAPSAKSYLLMDVILEACKKTGAEAVHPGYGFLSENTHFAQLLADNGIAFIGPSSQPIQDMGDKIHSKRIAKDAGVNCIPGFDGVVKDDDDAVKIANDIGYPVMIKASAGGGGKGMRIAWNDKEAREGFRLSSQEAESSFGDSRLLVEKFVDNPRHIEIQVLCDKHGNAIHLNERECSIQRRNQKVIEESPSPVVDTDLRKRMGDQALQLALAVGYDSAGTVEFLVDSQKNFYFLEMNTRLQVEHPITEAVTGIDLVHQMVRIAKGHSLKFKQYDIPVKGHALECRIYAEDPFKSFGMPSVGRLATYKEPSDIAGVRCDSGVKEGSEISMFYDPMICKLVSYGQQRKDAISTMVKALDSYVIRGVIHNIPLLRDIMTEPKFNAGDISTKYLPQVYPDGFHGRQLSDKQRKVLAALAICVHLKNEIRAKQVVNDSRRSLSQAEEVEWKLNAFIVKFDESHNAHVKLINGVLCCKIEDEEIKIPADDLNLTDLVLQPKINNEEETVQVISLNVHGPGVIRLRYQGTAFNVQVMRSKTMDLLKLMPEKPKVDVSKLVTSPMAGMVKAVACQVGDTVIEGQEVSVVEAMKMQNSLAVTATGKVKSVNCKVGDTVGEGEVLVELE